MSPAARNGSMPGAGRRRVTRTWWASPTSELRATAVDDGGPPVAERRHAAGHLLPPCGRRVVLVLPAVVEGPRHDLLIGPTQAAHGALVVGHDVGREGAGVGEQLVVRNHLAHQTPLARGLGVDVVAVKLISRA